jgi:hypothetical protein
MKNKMLAGKRIFAAIFLPLMLWGICVHATGETTTTEGATIGYYVNPLNLGGEGTDTIADFIIIAVRVLLSLVGTFSLIFLILGGTRYVVAVGDNDAMQAAKATVTSALTGLILSLMAYGLVGALEEILKRQS